MKSILTGSVLLLCGAALALASGDTEGAAGAGAADAGMAVGGEPYVDHIFADPAAYEAATGNRIEGFGEAPVLAALVAEGALPPVEERLPVDVQVVRPRDEIGSYGGIMRGAGSSEEPGSAIESSNQSMGSYPPDTQAIYPNLIKAWEAADDFTSLSITLRAGMKWSDGSPVTVDDFRFWYEDVLLNPEITPRVNSRWRPGGEVMAMTVVDDATIRYSFAAPFYSVFESWAFQRPVLPAEYLKQWHAAHNPQADAKAGEEGFDSWWKAFQDHEGGAVGKRSDPDRPSLHPWNVTEIGPASRLYERNPYYFKVDVAGNQLPYLDAVQITQFSQPNQTIPLRAMSGEIDLQTDHLAMADFPVYKENESTGDYQVYLFPFLSKGFAAGVALNYTHKDPVLREIFNDIRFRQALSLAIDRDDITNTFFFGRTVPHVAPVPPTWTGFEDWMRTYYAEFDPERANALLDEMGLQWDGNGQWRLRPDGEIVEFEGIGLAGDAFQDHEGGAVGKRSDPDRPSLHPWNVTEIGPASRLYERNPYYFKVDVAGNQLPYLDAVQITQFSQPNQTIPLRAMSGEIDLQTDHLAMADFPVYKENESTGDYQVYLFPFLSKGFAAGVALNYTHKDPVLREIFNDIRFRQALSLAIDRDDITNTFFFGRTVPHVAPVPPTWTGFEDWMRTYYAEFDPERANALLDEMGLQWDGNGQWRLRPDGEIVEFEGMWVAEWFSYFEGLVQMLSKQWEAVGVKMNPKFVVEEAAANIAIDNDQDALIGGNATSTEFRARGAEPVTLRPAWHWYSCCALAAAPWRLWHDTDGAEGIEPPQEIKELFTISEEWRNTPRGTDRYAELSHQMIRMNVENLYFFGTVSIPPKVVLVSDRLGNMQREGGFVQTLPNFGPHMLDTLFIRG